MNTLLPVLDTLEIAADAPTADESYKKGVTMTLDKCREAFGKMGVSEIEAQGKPFDPELHAAVLQQPSTDDMPSGTVTQVMRKVICSTTRSSATRPWLWPNRLTSQSRKAF